MEGNQVYFDSFSLDNIEMTLILKNGDEIDVPNMYVAASFVKGIYKDQVEKLVSKMNYTVI
jgi:hypothetical protein